MSVAASFQVLVNVQGGDLKGAHEGHKPTRPGRLIFHLSFCHYAPDPTIAAPGFDVLNLPGCGVVLKIEVPLVLKKSVVWLTAKSVRVWCQIGSGVVPKWFWRGSRAKMVSTPPTFGTTNWGNEANFQIYR